MPTVVAMRTRLTGVFWNPNVHPPLRNRIYGKPHWSCEDCVACPLGSCHCHPAAFPGALHGSELAPLCPPTRARGRPAGPFNLEAALFRLVKHHRSGIVQAAGPLPSRQCPRHRVSLCRSAEGGDASPFRRAQGAPELRCPVFINREPPSAAGRAPAQLSAPGSALRRLPLVPVPGLCESVARRTVGCFSVLRSPLGGGPRMPKKLAESEP